MGASTHNHRKRNSVELRKSPICITLPQKKQPKNCIPVACADYRDILNIWKNRCRADLLADEHHAAIAMENRQSRKTHFVKNRLIPTIPKILETKKTVEAAGVKMQVGFNCRFDHNFCPHPQPDSIRRLGRRAGCPYHRSILHRHPRICKELRRDVSGYDHPRF